MNQDTVINLATQAMMLALKIAGPMLLMGLIVGLLVSIFQAVTSIQEQSLSFIPKIVGVALDDSGRQNIVRFARKMGVNYPVLQGTEKVAESYGGVNGLPESFFIDRSGKIADHEVGLVSSSVFELKIKKLLTQKENPASAAAH